MHQLKRIVVFGSFLLVPAFAQAQPRPLYSPGTGYSAGQTPGAAWGWIHPYRQDSWRDGYDRRDDRDWKHDKKEERKRDEAEWRGRLKWDDRRDRDGDRDWRGERWRRWGW